MTTVSNLDLAGLRVLRDGKGVITSVIDDNGKNVGLAAFTFDVDGNVTGLMLPNGSSNPINKDPVGKTRVLVIGSSNAYGVGASAYANSWVGLLASALSATHDFTNVALGGKSVDYWVGQDANSVAITAAGVKCNLEIAIDAYRPHVVIGALVTQNGIDTSNQSTAYIQGNANAFIASVLKAKSICEMRGIRYVGVTPYGSNAFTTKNWSAVRAIGDQLAYKGVTLVDFFNVSYQGGVTIPASIDSGDGLHVNDAGHLQQFRSFPQAYLKMGVAGLNAPVRCMAVDAGLVFPADTTTLSPLITDSFPTGGWTVGMKIKSAATQAVVTGFSFAGDNNTTRLRASNPTMWEVAGSAVLQNTPAFAANEEQHVCLVYNQILSMMYLYINGVLASSNSATAANTFTGLILGGRTDVATFNAAGYRFRNVTIHASSLNARDVRLLAGGDIPSKSLFAAYPLVDGFSRAIGDSFAGLCGDVSLNSSITVI